MPAESIESILTQPNWEAVKLAYLQGTPLAEIAKAHDLTISQVRNRAYRAGWRHDLHPDANSHALAYQKLVNEWVENMSVSLLARSKWYANNDLIPSTLRDNKDIETAIQAHINSGRALFGLDKDISGRSSTWGRSDKEGPVIDVTPVPLPSDSAKPA